MLLLTETFDSLIDMSVAPRYTYAGALVVGVSKYKSINPALQRYPDLTGVTHSVKLMADMWSKRYFDVCAVSDVDPTTGQWVAAVTEKRIKEAALYLACKASLPAGRASLLVVHLIGHGVSDARGGLVLSDAITTPNDKVSCFNLDALRGILSAHVAWTGCNILVICDFCNSGALVKDDIGPLVGPPLSGYARQVLTSSLPYANGYMTIDKTQSQLTALLMCALGPNSEAFEPGETGISVRDLRGRLQALGSTSMFQALLLGRIWSDWHSTPNDGDIILYRHGNGMISAPTPAPARTSAPAPIPAPVWL